MERQITASRSDTATVKRQPLAPREAEAMLRSRLAGRRMVFELGLDEADFRRFRKPLFELLRGRSVSGVRREFPALFVTYMTYAGTFLYEGGDYWGNLHPYFREPDVDPGDQFILAVRKLGLETFDRILTEEKAWRWVSRILAQGGIPRSCLGPFAGLVAREVQAGAADGAELLASWRTRGASLTQLHVPTRRFLLYGGDEAADLMDRCVEAIRDRARLGRPPTPSETGLPQYVLDALVSEESALSHGSAAIPEGVPRPQLRLEPYDGLGAVVTLPRVPSDQLGGMWRVEAGEQVYRHAPSSYANDSVRVPPARVAEVEFLSAEGLRRRWSFELLEPQAALFFDPTSQVLIRNTGALAADEIWVLSDAGAQITATFDDGDRAAREIQELPAPSGWWSGFALRHLDLAGVRALRITDSHGRTYRTSVIPPRAKPSLSGPLVDGVHAQGEMPVFSGIPHVDVPVGDSVGWSVTVHGPSGPRTELVEPDASGRINLIAFCSEPHFGAYRLRVRGPIGSDLAARFAIVPGLEITRPESILMPDARSAEVTLSARDATCNGGAAGAPEVLQLAGAQATTAGAQLAHKSGRELDLTVRVPRLLWTIVHDTKPVVAASDQRVRVGAEEFEDHLADRLLVTTGRAGVQIQLTLDDRDGRTVADLPAVTTAGESGRWAFDLGPLAETIRTAGGSRMSMHLQLGVRRVHVADVVGGAHVRTVYAQSEGEVLRVSFDEDRPVHDRVVRLWSASRPWTPPVQEPVVDGTTSVPFCVGELLPPGDYLAEVSVDDPWVAPVRPAPGSPGVRPVYAGDRDQARSWLTSLDPGDPLTLVTWVISRHRGETTFPIERLADVSGEIAQAFQALLSETAAGQGSGQRFTSLANVVMARDRILVDVLSQASELATDSLWLDRLDLRLAVLMDPKSDETDPHQLRTVWQSFPGVASRLDLPWVGLDEQAMDRCRLSLGWAPDDGPPDPSGSKVRQLELQMPAGQLRDLRFSLGLQPRGLLDPETRVLATFDWLLVHHQQGAGESSAPHDWYSEFKGLRDTDSLPINESLRTLLDSHLDARQPPYGTEPWAAVPAILLAANAHHRWGNDGQPRFRALRALEEALPWARRLIRSDSALITALESHTTSE